MLALSTFISAATLSLAVFGFTALTGTAAAAKPEAKKDNKVGICHATGSKTNPYVFIEVDRNAVKAHQKHQHGRDKIGATSAKDCPGVGGGNLVFPAQPQQHNLSHVVPEGESAPTTLPETGMGMASVIGAAVTSLASGVLVRRK